jgi:chromosomal replication initiator protein
MKEDHAEVWEACLSVIKDNINHQSFKTWFLPIKAVKLEENVLTIEVPSQFFYEWLEEHYINLLKKTIRKELGPKGRLEYSIVMDNSFNNTPAYTIKVPTSHRQSTGNQPVSMPLDINRGMSKEIPNPLLYQASERLRLIHN